MTPENIYYIFKTIPHAKGHIERKLMGKFMLFDGKFELLEDHGLPKRLAEASPAEAARVIERYTHSMYFEVVNMHDIINGLHPELIKDTETKAEIDEDIKTAIGQRAAGPKSEDFEYDRIGGEGPRVLSVSDGQVFLDGNLLTADEINRVQDHVRSKQAFLRRKMAKSESIYNPGMDPRMHRALNEDSAIPNVGNLRAYNNFIQNAPPGLHVHINAHGIRDINRQYGHEHGNRAIKAMGSAIAHVANSLVGENARTFRVGGDRFMVHVPSTEAAALFSRGLRTHLEGIPALNGTHKLTFSAGIGPSKEHADWALHSATEEKNRRGYPPGQAKSHINLKLV